MQTASHRDPLRPLTLFFAAHDDSGVTCSPRPKVLPWPPCLSLPDPGASCRLATRFRPSPFFFPLAVHPWRCLRDESLDEVCFRFIISNPFRCCLALSCRFGSKRLWMTGRKERRMGDRWPPGRCLVIDDDEKTQPSAEALLGEGLSLSPLASTRYFPSRLVGSPLGIGGRPGPESRGGVLAGQAHEGGRKRAREHGTQ